MAVPTVFVSSTFYDLRYVREGIRRFIESFGYVAVLSEEGTVFYDPKVSAAEACIGEIGNADMLVLILGGRYGASMPGEDRSVTNAEYQQAIREGIPVFALIENDTLSDYQLYLANHERPEILKEIVFPHADSTRIFEFISEVRGQVANNALVPFRTASDIESYLRSQWAGMLHGYLGRDNQEAKVATSLEMLAEVNTRIELLAEQILHRVGDPLDRVVVQLLQEMVNSKVVADLRFINTVPTPACVLSYKTAVDFAASQGVRLYAEEREDEDEDSSRLSSDGGASRARFEEMSASYSELREKLEQIVSKSSVKITEISAYERDNPEMMGADRKKIGRPGRRTSQPLTDSRDGEPVP